MKWKIIAIATVLVAAWMFRWENISGANLHLDRWTGNLVGCDRETSVAIPTFGSHASARKSQIASVPSERSVSSGTLERVAHLMHTENWPRLKPSLTWLIVIG